MAEQQEFVVKRVKRQTLNRTVYENIKKSILSGDIPAGAKLSEVQMGRQLGVSATPVREAFRMLSMEGLLTIDPWKGAVVQGYSERAAIENSQCREALEVMALRLFLEKKSEKDLSALRYMIKEAADTEDISDFVQISSAIHDIWIKGCDNSRIALMLSQLNDVTLRERNISANDRVRRQQILDEHKELLTALETGDGDRAAAALATHIKNGFSYIQQKKKD